MTAKRKHAVFHYISGASMRGIRIMAGGNSADVKRNRFLAVAGIAAAAWLAALIWF